MSPVVCGEANSDQFPKRLQSFVLFLEEQTQTNERMNTNKQTKKQKIYHHTKKNKHKVKVQHVLGVGGMGKGWKGGKVMIS